MMNRKITKFKMWTIELNYFGLSVSKNHRHRAQEIKGLSWKLTSYNLQLFVLSPTFLESGVNRAVTSACITFLFYLYLQSQCVGVCDLIYKV